MTTHQAGEVPQHRAARVRRGLAEDPRTAELGVRVSLRGNHAHLSGEIDTEQRKAALEEVLREMAPEMPIHNDVRVSNPAEPTSMEELR